jgi:putative FmdB family regulatory protein
MPVYEFECPRCEAFETIVRSYNSDTVPTCWKCDAVMVIRWSAPAVVFKGAGWAKKDRTPNGGK